MEINKCQSSFQSIHSFWKIVRQVGQGLNTQKERLHGLANPFLQSNFTIVTLVGALPYLLEDHLF